MNGINKYYIESDRIVSKIGGGMSFFWGYSTGASYTTPPIKF